MECESESVCKIYLCKPCRFKSNMETTIKIRINNQYANVTRT